MIFSIRPAQTGDGVEIQKIERLAGERFREIGMDAVANDDPPDLVSLARYAYSERSWIASDDAGHPIGYILVDELDRSVHIAQVSVVPSAQSQGVGRALIERAANWGIEHGVTTMTLTTFANVSWNQPLYEHLGFRVLDEGEIGPELASLREHEASMGLDPATRVCMGRELKA